MDTDKVMQRRELMLRVATRLGDNGFVVDPRFRLTLVRMMRDVSVVSAEDSRSLPEYGQPIYIKTLGNGHRIIAKVDREKDGMIDPNGSLSFETWNSRGIVDIRNERIDAFLSGLGPRPMMDGLKMTVEKIRKFAHG